MTQPRTIDFAMFEPNRPWLEKQPGMNPWADGCAGLGVQLHGWLDEYHRTVCGSTPGDREAAAIYLARLWHCWAHHWKQAAGLQPDGTIDGWEVAERIRSGRGYEKGCRLGGDPLRDVVLAEAAGRNEPDAIQSLEQEYKEWSIAQAAKIDPAVAGEPEDFWCRLLDRLVGYSDPPGKLAKYHGRCGLRNWLATVAKNFARQERRLDPPDPPESDPDAEPCRRLLALFVQPALKGLSSDDQVLLYWLFVEEQQGKEVAALLELHPGQVTRRKQQALEAWRDGLLQAAQQVAQEADYVRCLVLLLRQRNLRDFGGGRHAGLSGGRPAELEADVPGPRRCGPCQPRVL